MSLDIPRTRMPCIISVDDPDINLHHKDARAFQGRHLACLSQSARAGVLGGAAVSFLRLARVVGKQRKKKRKQRDKKKRLNFGGVKENTSSG